MEGFLDSLSVRDVPKFKEHILYLLSSSDHQFSFDKLQALAGSFEVDPSTFSEVRVELERLALFAKTSFVSS